MQKGFGTFNNNSYFVNQKKCYVFSQINNLSLHDMKSQKKTMSMKKFNNLPLSHQEKMDQRFNQSAFIHENSFSEHSNSASVFRIRKEKKKRKIVERLSVPKKVQFQSEYENKQTLKGLKCSQDIIQNCSKLKHKLITGIKIEKLLKHTNRQYENLMEKSKLCLIGHSRRR